MKIRIIVPILFAARLAFAQGTVIFDQQSSDESRVLEGSIGYPGQAPSQSFTPSFTSMDFVRLWIIQGGPGQSLAVNLRADSPTGTILGTSAATTVTGTSSYTGALTFLFPNQVALVPGNTYYIQPVAVVGLGFVLNQSAYFYSGGSMFSGSVPDPSGRDLWFREGIVVPEPATASLILFGGSIFLWKRKKHWRSVSQVSQ